MNGLPSTIWCFQGLSDWERTRNFLGCRNTVSVVRMHLFHTRNLGDNYAVFEPTHGSAPKYAGQYKVNPIAMLLTTKLMLDWLNETERATRLESAIARVIAEGQVRTYDMGGNASTLDVAKAVAD